jgi:hypothetical protein
LATLEVNSAAMAKPAETSKAGIATEHVCFTIGFLQFFDHALWILKASHSV